MKPADLIHRSARHEVVDQPDPDAVPAVGSIAEEPLSESPTHHRASEEDPRWTALTLRIGQ
ncbi:MAG: hypothetical protein ACJ72D_06345 [Marmoricola sp.]